MSYKMSELVEISKTPKSTILYYIKEGILPPPVKLKANVHAYDETTLKMLEFIRYVQTNFRFSIGELKDLVNMPNFSFEHSYETLFENLEQFMSPVYKNVISKDEICEMFGMDEKQIDELVLGGLLFTRRGEFTEKEVEILNIVQECKKIGVGEEIVKLYIEFAAKLSQIEANLGHDVLGRSEDKNALLRSFFDLTLILKPYLFNLHTLRAYERKIDE